MADYHRILSRKNNQLCEEGCQTPTLPPSPPPFPSPFFGDEHPGRRLTNFLLIAAAIFAASLLLSLTYYAVLRRRRRPLGVAAAVPAPDDDDAASLEEGEPFHHVWYIRTVGLDESTIGSIAVTEYRAGDGLLDGVSDCSVCLGEFREGERVRLLPKCGHAFHVPCIDTWLQAHVNCPLCRAHIVDPDAEPGPPTASDAALPITAAGESMELDSGSSALVETLQIGIQPLEEEGHQQQQNERRSDSLIEIGIPSNPSHVFDSLPESSVSRLQSDLVRCGLQPVRRSFSMDTPMMHSIVIRMEPEEGAIDEEGKDPNFEEEIGPKNREKQGNSSKGVVDGKDHSSIGRSLSSSGRGFFFSRNGWAARIHSMPM